MKRKLSIIAIALLLLLALTFSLVACDPKPSNNEVVTKQQRETLDLVMAGHGFGANAVLSTSFAIDVDIDGIKHNVAIRTNLNGKQSQLLIEIKDGEGVLKTGFYIIDGKIYFDMGADKAKLYLADFDVSDIIQMVLEKDWIAELDGVLEGLDYSFDGVLDMIAPLMFSEAVVTKEGNLDVYTMNIKLNEVFGMLTSVVGELNIDKMLFDMGINIDFNVTDFILGIVIPKDLTVKLVSKMDGDKTVSTEIIGNMAEAALFNISLDGGVFAENQNLGFPESVLDFTPFSLTNICFDATLNIASDKLDLADIVNLLTGAKTLPKGVLIFNSDKDFSVKFRMDLDINDNLKNLVYIDIFAGKNFDSKLVGIYFYEGNLYIDYASILPNGTNLANMKIENIDISKQLRAMVSMITGTIAADTTNQNGVQSITTKTSEATLSPDLIAFASSVVNLIGANDNVKLEGNKVSIKINKTLIDMISSLITDVSIEYPDFLGDIDIDINLDPNKGIDNVDITANLPDYNSTLKVNLNNFMIGYINSAIKENIEKEVLNKTYITNYTEILNKAMEGTRIQGEFKINLPKGEYDLADFFTALNINIPSIKYQLTEDIVDEVFTIDMKMQLDPANKNNNKISIEVKATRDNAFCKTGLFIGLYHQDNAMYLDASNITIAGFRLPIMKIDVDFASLLADEIAKLNNGSLFAEASDPFTIPSENKSTITAVNDIIETNIDNKKLVILATSKAIANILAANGIDITLPEFTVTGEIISLNDINIKLASGELNVDFDVTNIVVGEIQTFDFVLQEDTYYEDLVEAMMHNLAKLDLKTTIDISSKDGKLDVTNFINGILSATGNSLQVPIEFEMVNYNSSLDLIIKWNIDTTNSANTQLMLELRTVDTQKTLLFGFYLYNDNTYIEIPAISAKFKIENLGLSKKVTEAFASLQSEVTLNIGNIIKDLLAGREINIKPTPKANLTNMADGGLTLPSDFVQYLFDGLSLKNTTVGLNYTAELLGKMLLSIGVDTGVSASLTGSMDVVAGTLSLNGTLGVLSLGITAKVVSLGEDVAIGFSDELFKDFKALDATNGVTLTDTFFSQMTPEFNIDVFTNNMDQDGGSAKTRIVFKKSGKEQTIMDVDLKVDDLMLVIYDGFQSTGKPWMYVFITDEKLYVKGTDEWFSKLAGQIKGSAVAFDLPMNIKAMLYDMMNGLLQVINPTPAVVDNTVTNMADTQVAIGIDSLIEKIQVALMPTDQTRISIRFNAANFNTFITDTINNLLHSAVIEGVPGADLSKVTYSSETKWQFIDQLWTNFIAPFIKNQIPDWQWAIAQGVLNDQIKPFLRRLLPIPFATDAAIHINLDQNKLSSIEINIRDLRADKNHVTDIDIVNTAAEGTIDWSSIYKNHTVGGHLIADSKTQATYVEYDPYSSKTFSDYFNKQARKIVNGKYEYENIVWTLDDVAFDPSKQVDRDKLIYREEPYIIKGTAFGQSINVSVKVMASTSIIGVKPITMSPYGKLPSKIEIILEDGTTREVDYAEMTNVAPTTFAKHSVTGKVKLQGGEYDITINYLDATVKNLMGGTNFYRTAYQYGLGEYLLPSSVNIQFMYGGHMTVPAEYDYKDLTNIKIDGGVRNVDLVIAKGTPLAQTIKLTYTITAKTVSQIEYNSVTFDKYNVDPYDVFTNGIGAFNPKATVYYTDGSYEELDLTWNIEGVVNSYEGVNSTAKVKYTAGTLSWEREVNVAMARRDAMYLDFNGDKVIEVNPLMWAELGKDHYFPANAKVVFETGGSAILPITWDLTNLDVENPSGSFNNITATIASGDFMQTVQVPVRVKPVRPVGIVLENNVYTINPIDVIYGGKQAFSDKLTVKFADDRQEDVAVVWDHKNVTIDMNGGSYKATVGVGNFNFEIDVVVTNCSDIVLKDNALTIDPMFYIAVEGSGIYAEELTYTSNGIDYILPVVWSADAVVINKEGGSYTATVTIGSGTDAKTSNVAVTVINREIASIVLTNNTINIEVGGSLPTTLTVTFKDGSTMELDPIYGVFDNATAGNYDVEVKFFVGTTLEQTFTITIIVSEVATEPAPETVA